ncbi:MAG: hypothetical protein CFE21_14245 [Bacteroidetes bacterium B1(2017)]|nr:MAG: hypothetical protein CFE21_14245 [Bacteroidetes bacterium B1(2017)]
MEKKCCGFCHQSIVGRPDKKFCDDQCRSAFNNKTNSALNSKMRHINGVLKKNRNILERLYIEKNRARKHIYERKIQELGFIFNFYTHTEELEDGKICYYCYDYGYIPIKQGELAVIKVK